MPIPTGIVSRTTPAAPGQSARTTPNVPTASTAAATATREPARATRYGAGGAKTPMQSTGIVPSRPATAWLTPRSSWIAGRSGPDADELRAQRQRGEEQRDEERAAPHARR